MVIIFRKTVSGCSDIAVLKCDVMPSIITGTDLMNILEEAIKIWSHTEKRCSRAEKSILESSNGNFCIADLALFQNNILLNEILRGKGIFNLRIYTDSSNDIDYDYDTPLVQK